MILNRFMTKLRYFPSKHEPFILNYLIIRKVSLIISIELLFLQTHKYPNIQILLLSEPPTTEVGVSINVIY